MALVPMLTKRAGREEQIVLYFDNPRCASDDQPTFDSHRSNRRIACSIAQSNLSATSMNGSGRS